MKVQSFQTSFIHGDEPLKYIDSQHSKQEAVQTTFYKKGLYKQQGRFSRALMYLLEFNRLWQTSSEDDLHLHLLYPIIVLLICQILILIYLQRR